MVTERSWRTAGFCGPNSLYIFLRMWDINIAYDSWVNTLQINPDGTSLLELQQWARNAGLRTSVVRCHPDRLKKVRLPAIAHLESDSEGTFDGGLAGHYIVLLSYGTDKIQYIDGTTARIGTMNVGEFQRLWTGYALIRSADRLCFAWAFVPFAGALVYLLAARHGMRTSLFSFPRTSTS